MTEEKTVIASVTKQSREAATGMERIKPRWPILDCRVGLRPPRNDEANSPVIASNAKQSREAPTGTVRIKPRWPILDCRVGLRPPRNDGTLGLGILCRHCE